MPRVQKPISNTGTYLLVYYLPHETQLYGIKRFSEITLAPGYYYYSGSAQKGLKHRICRHLKKTKTIHWHVDHVTACQDFHFTELYIFPDAPRSFECEMVKILERKFLLEYPLEKFGNSDCSICKSHLLYSKEIINHNHLFSLYQSTVLLTPADKETFCL